MFAQLRRFTLAVLAAAETAADFAGILYSNAPSGGEADVAEPLEPLEFEKRAIVTMPGGRRMSQLEAQQPSSLVRLALQAVQHEMNEQAVMDSFGILSE